MHEADGTESPSGVQKTKALCREIDVVSSWQVRTLSKLTHKVWTGYASGGLAGEISQETGRLLNIVSAAAVRSRTFLGEYMFRGWSADVPCVAWDPHHVYPDAFIRSSMPFYM